MICLQGCTARVDSAWQAAQRPTARAGGGLSPVPLPAGARKGEFEPGCQLPGGRQENDGRGAVCACTASEWQLLRFLLDWKDVELIDQLVQLLRAGLDLPGCDFAEMSVALTRAAQTRAWMHRRACAEASAAGEWRGA